VTAAPVRVLNVVDEFTRVGLGSRVARRIGTAAVEQHLAKLFAEHGKPTLIRADNGHEFIADRLLDWLAEQRVRGVFIAKASPQQNGYQPEAAGSRRGLRRPGPRAAAAASGGLATGSVVVLLVGGSPQGDATL
jgi:hypothetical protein